MWHTLNRQKNKMKKNIFTLFEIVLAFGMIVLGAFALSYNLYRFITSVLEKYGNFSAYFAHNHLAFSTTLQMFVLSLLFLGQIIASCLFVKQIYKEEVSK